MIDSAPTSSLGVALKIINLPFEITLTHFAGGGSLVERSGAFVGKICGDLVGVGVAIGVGVGVAIGAGVGLAEGVGCAEALGIGGMVVFSKRESVNEFFLSGDSMEDFVPP